MSKLNNKLLLIFLGALLSFPLLTYAKDKPEKRFPHGCTQHGFKFEHQMLTLKPTRLRHPQTMYFIHNISDKKITLMQMRTGDEPWVIHVNNQLKPGKWSALAMDEKVSKYLCTTPKGKSIHGEYIDCGKVLDICEYTRTTFADNNRGNYWAVSNRTLNGSIRAIIRQGVLLRWKKGSNS